MTDGQAALLVKRLLGSYPSLSLHDPETYITELVSLLTRYPDWVGEKAIELAKAESPTFVPSVPIVGKACKDAIGTTQTSLTYAQEWDERARLQLEERNRFDRQSSEAPGEDRAAVVDRIRADMAAAGMPIMGDGQYRYRETEDVVKARLGLSDAEWDALPNAPASDTWENLQASHMPKRNEAAE